MSERKIDLSGLPRRGKLIDWKNSVGYKCKFVYDDVKGEVEIIGYKIIKNRPYLTVEYENRIYRLPSDSLLKCTLGKILCKTTIEFKIEIGYTLKYDNIDMIIIDREYKKNKNGKNLKWYKYKCNKCGYDEGWIEESSFIRGRGCSCCAGKKVVPGINDIVTTDPWMIKYLENKDDAYKYTSKSGKRIKVICPDCGRIKRGKSRIADIYRNNSIGCSCSDKISYPNKFMFNMLEQLDVDFITEYSPEWISPKRFDFYIPSKNLIIEMDGGWHTKDNNMSGQTKEESKEIDNWKDEQAELHGINIIRIDCDYNNENFKYEYIKDNVINSKLIQFYKLDFIDWDVSDEFATSNLIKNICTYYEKNKNELSYEDLCEIFGFSRTTISHYLKKGKSLNWCNGYNGRKNKMVLVVELNKTFKNATDCSKYLSKFTKYNFNVSGIYKACLNKQSSYKGFTFKYV